MKNIENEKLNNLMEITPLSINIFTKEMDLLWCNKNALELFGFEKEEEYFENFYKLYPKIQPNGETSKELEKAHFDEVMEKGKQKFSWLYLNLKGEEIPTEIDLVKTIGDNNEPIFIAYIRDLRLEFMNADEGEEYGTYFLDKISAKTFLAKIEKLSGEWFLILDLRTKHVQIYGRNVIAKNAKHGSIQELNNETLADIVHEEDLHLYYKLVENMNNGIYEPIDIRYLQEDGSYRYYRIVYEIINDKTNAPVFLVGKGMDIHKEKIFEERSKKDLLTGIKNKISVELEIKERLLETPDKQKGIFIIDIDNFKEINDNLGHYFGDLVLRDLAENLKNAFRAKDIIGRLGGDEFIVLMDNIVDIDILEKKANKILELLNKTYSEKDSSEQFITTASVGIALYPDCGTNYKDIYMAADKALYHAKHKGKNQHVFYSDALANTSMLNLTKIDSAERLAETYFEYDIISSIFKIIYDEDGNENAINSAIKYICETYNADRCFIIESLDKGKTYTNTFEWCKEGISEEKEAIQNLPCEVLEELFKSSKGGMIYSNNIAPLIENDEAYALMDKQGIKSFLHAQVEKDGYVPFFIGIDDCTKIRIWSEKEINSLQYVSKIISVVMQQKNLEKNLENLARYNKLSAFVSDSTDNIIYISDIDTYALIHINQATRNLLGNPDESVWKGKKCYEILQGKSEPCSFCTNHIINDNEFYEWTYFNPLFNKTYLLKDKLVPVDGKLARIEIATDITRTLSLETEVQEKLEEEKLLVSCINMIHSEQNPEESIEKALEIIGKFYNSERSYIFEISPDETIINNTYEWCLEGITPYIDDLKNIPVEIAGRWFEKFEEGEEFYINSLSDDVDKESEEYKILEAQGISALIAAPLRDRDKKIIGFIGVDDPKAKTDRINLLRSVSKFIGNFLEETERLEELNLLSYYDMLTGIKNRNSFRKNLENISKESIFSLGIAYIDIENLNLINDMYGILEGDRVLKELAQNLSEIFDEDCYRIDGDEFVVLKKNIEEKDFEEKIDMLKEKRRDNKYDISLGFVWNKNYAKIASQGENVSYKKYTELVSDNLEKEIESGKYIVYLQPQMKIESRECNGAEALIRRKSAFGEIKPPIEFVPFYEKEGIISKIDIFVFETACKTLKEWKDMGNKKDIPISVNCSRITLNLDGIVDIFSNLCKKYDVDKASIIIEITETISSTRDEIFSKTISNFAEAGFTISLDDFGNGYSNLSTLKLSSFNEIKIDRSLTTDLGKDKKSKILVKTILNICKELENIASVAEGIETEEQYEALREMGCRIGQGFLFDMPMPIEDFTKKYISEDK